MTIKYYNFLLDSSEGCVLVVSSLAANYQTWLDVSDQEVLLSEHPDINIRGKVKSVF